MNNITEKWFRSRRAELRRQKRAFSRRGFLGAAGSAALASFWANDTIEAYQNNVRTASKPSDLQITDMRLTTMARMPMGVHMIRLDTNQGISGYGEVRDGATETYALMLKSRILRENPCNIDKIFRKIKQFGFHARQAGGVCGVEMALWDLAGKAYGVPAFQMLGGKFRDRIRLYADTTESHDPKVFADRLKARMTEKGFTFLKMDLGYDLVENIPGCVTRPLGRNSRMDMQTIHMFTGAELTDKGVGLMADFVMKIRDVIGFEVPLAADHFGHIGVNSCIRLGKALEKCNLSWLEDMIPWQYTDLWKQITMAVDIPTLTGEDIFLKEPFIELCKNHAVDLIQPDLASSGGLLETKKIGDMAMEYGHAMAMHFAGSPISFFANVHCAAATENFVVLEHHSVDVPWWDDLVNGVTKPIIDKGFANLPTGPGLGFELNEEVLKQHLAPNTQLWMPTDQWNNIRSNDRLYS